MGMAAPICAAVHGVFADGSLDVLRNAGAAQIVTTNTIAHESNAMDVSKSLAAASHEFLDGEDERIATAVAPITS